MKLCRCPACHVEINLQQLVQDEAGSELHALLAKTDTETGTALVSYIALFRSASRNLANDRALKLAREVLEIESTQWLTPALQETVESIMDKRVSGNNKPLTNHNYLKRVLESVIQRGVMHQPSRTQIDAPAPYNSAAGSMQRIKDTDW